MTRSRTLAVVKYSETSRCNIISQTAQEQNRYFQFPPLATREVDDLQKNHCIKPSILYKQLLTSSSLDPK